NELIFAVSKTADPTGAYYIYTFEPDAADFADYPKYSIWSDGYYETCNCDRQKVTVYERAKMLNGDQTAGFIVIPSITNPNSNGGFFCPQTLFADGQLPPYGSPQYMFDYTDDNWGAGFSDRIRIYQITANWTGKTGTLAAFDSLTPKPFNSYFTGGSMSDISQPGSSTKLDALDGFFSYRIPYMRWSNYNSAVMCHPVNTGTGSTIVSGIRWYELRQDTTSKKWSIFQQGTYAPADGVSRWNPGIGMDMNGSIALAYSVSAPSGVYPGTRYTGRTKCDSAGIMTLAEGTAISGSSSWNSNRWGDYSHTSLDPSDGITFWHTNQYMGAGTSLRSRIFSFKIPACVTTGITSYDLSNLSLTAVQSGALMNIRATGLPTDEQLELDVFNMEGKLIHNERISPVAGILDVNLNTEAFAKGIYFVRIVNNRFQRVLKVAIQ
ncbi:MAG TPA: T9SS type A sorting domain-containing protein, partial [Bacteroidia bacterium]|nr:T9SS type A sorting domain-containing protein [Bacteroidia bacterium]